MAGCGFDGACGYKKVKTNFPFRIVREGLHVAALWYKRVDVLGE